MKYWVGAESLPLSRQLIADLARAGMMAPSNRKTPPWRIHVSPERQTIEFHTIPGRGVVCTDAGGRILHVACGAAVFNLCVAAAVAGREPIVKLLPEPTEPSLLATVRLAGPHSARPAERELHAAMIASHDGPGPAAGERVPDALLAQVADAACTEGATMRVIEDQEAASPPTLTRAVGAADFAFVQNLPQLAVLSTTMGGGTGWLRAGQALERVLLTAAGRGVVAIPFVPVPAFAGNRQVIYEHIAVDEPLIILRLGYAPQSTGHRTKLLTIGLTGAPIVPYSALPSS